MKWRWTNLTIEEVKTFAIKKGGQCLSDSFSGMRDKLLWKCHVEEHPPWWTSAERVIKRNRWCVKCHQDRVRDSENKLKKLAEIAELKGGKLLSNKYTRNDAYYLFQCSEGHVWKTKARTITSAESWCPLCASFGMNEEFCRAALEQLFQTEFPKIRPDWLINPNTERRLELDGFSEKLKIAFEYQGPTHYKQLNLSEKLEEVQFRDKIKVEKCKENDVKLLLIPELNSYNKKTDIKNLLLKLIKEHDITLTKEILETELNFKNLYSSSSPAHKHNSQIKINKLSEFAKTKNGLLISTSYLGCDVELEWYCNIHQVFFKKSPSSIKQGTWCSLCGKERSFLTHTAYSINQLQKLAHLRGGHCLSSKYINVKIAYDWQCKEKNHPSFKACIKSILNGNWCWYCKKEGKETFQKIKMPSND